MMRLLLEGPFESDYSLAIVNRQLAGALQQIGVPLLLHQRDNTTAYFPSDAFLAAYPRIAPLFVKDVTSAFADVHSRYIYPPFTDSFRAPLHVVHCYGWEESVFPEKYVQAFNADIDLITVMSEFVREVLHNSGVRVPVEVVGLGADHILSEPARPGRYLSENSFHFLHVSSCFPRKAVDVLVRAFCEEFTRRDDVRLVIKTFPNPHNVAEKVVHEADATYPRHAPIEVIWDPVSLPQMRYLYERAGCLVSPSRGEGFGLPVAEAMFLGCPVIATIYSGQADLCTADTCWPVEYDMEPARTHLTEKHSMWANPRVESLRAQMRAVYAAPASERASKTESAQRRMLSRFTWRQVAGRHWNHCQARLAEIESDVRLPAGGQEQGSIRLGFVTSWNTRCGIAEYTRHLATSLPGNCSVVVFANRSPETVRPDEEFVSRCWNLENGSGRPAREIEELARAIVDSQVDALSIQYNFGFFSPSDLLTLIRLVKNEGIAVTVTMHATNHPNLNQMRPVFEAIDDCICHRESDVAAVRSFGAASVVLQKQGIVPARLNRSRAGSSRSTFLITCFGFFLPPKGIYQLIQAFALARSVQPVMRLKLLNALYPIPESENYARQCLQLIQKKHLAAHVEIDTAFLDVESILEELADSDLVVLPYTYSSESSSAAGASAIASLAPVLCSDLPIFDELAGTVHRFPAGDVIALANKLVQLAADPVERNRYAAQQRELVESRSWPNIARQFADHLMRRTRRLRRGQRSMPAISGSD